VPSLFLGPSCPLQTGCVWGPAATVMALWRTFLKIWSMPYSHYSLEQAPTPDPASSISKDVGCYARLDGQHSFLRTYHGIFFSRAEKPSKDKAQHLFLKNINGLIGRQIVANMAFYTFKLFCTIVK
jgi:hypothetical protein